MSLASRRWMTAPANDDQPPGEAAGESAPGGDRAARARRRPWTEWHPLALLALGFGFYYLLRLVWAATDFLLVAFLGVLFGLALSSAVDVLARWRIPRGVAAAGVVLLFYGVLFGAGSLLAPTLRKQAGELQRQLPQALERADRWLESRSDGVLGTLIDSPERAGDSAAVLTDSAVDASNASGGAGATSDTSRGAGATSDTAGGAADTSVAVNVTDTGQSAGDDGPSLQGRIADAARGSARFIRPVLSGTVAAVTGFLLISVIAIYLAADPKAYSRGMLMLLPHRARPRAREVLDETGSMLRRWLITQLVAMVAIGVVTTGVLLLLGVEAAFALGLIAGLLEFVPLAGPVIAAIPAIGMAFVESPRTALYVAIAFIGIQQLESNVLTPLLMKRGLEMPPILTLAAQGVMTLLFGFLGLLVAVPLTAALLVPIRMLYVEDRMDD